MLQVRREMCTVVYVQTTSEVASGNISGTPAEAVSEIVEDGGLEPTSRGEILQSTKGKCSM